MTKLFLQWGQCLFCWYSPDSQSILNSVFNMLFYNTKRQITFQDWYHCYLSKAGTSSEKKLYIITCFLYIIDLSIKISTAQDRIYSSNYLTSWLKTDWIQLLNSGITNNCRKYLLGHSSRRYLDRDGRLRCAFEVWYSLNW